MRRTRGAQSLFAACVLALAVAAVSGGEVPSVLSTGRVDVAVNPLDDAPTGATPPANRSEASRDASAGRGTPARLWDDVVRQATAGSWRDDWFWVTSFRPVSDAAAKPALEMATFAPLANGGFRWVCVFYERWELDGDPAAARPETPMTRRSLKTRCWHKGSAGEFKFLGRGSRINVPFSTDWEEIRWNRPPILPKPLASRLSELQQLLDGKPVPAHGNFVPVEGLGTVRPATTIALGDPAVRVEPPAWSQGPAVVFSRD